MTTQDAYEKIREFFSRPGARIALSKARGICEYRVGGKAGAKTRCAVGCLIPDSEYDPEFETLSVSSVHERVPSLAGVDLNFLARAQDAHDSAKSVKEFIENLDDLAREYGLTVPS